MIGTEIQRILNALPSPREPTRTGMISLLDVLERYSFSFHEIMRQAGALQYVARLGTSAQLYPHQREEVSAFLDQLQTECDALGFSGTSELTAYTKSRFVERDKDYTSSELSQDLDRLIFSFGKELKSKLFLSVPDAKERYFQSDELFGPEVAQAFPSSEADIQHAGTCFALDQDAACVFHLMRVLERGLNVLAGRLAVSFDRRNWENVINDIEPAIKKAGSGADPEQRKLYAETARHFRFIKDAWRNDIMHARDEYDEGKALSVLTHVHEFMRALAVAGLSEES